MIRRRFEAKTTCVFGGVDMKQLATCFLILLSCTCSAQEQSNSFCVPDAEFVIGGISRQASRSQILAIKGEPTKNIVDDELMTETLEYPDMAIVIANNRVLCLATSSPGVGTPSGVSPGMSKSEVMKILGYTDVDMQQSEFQFVNCVTEVYLVLRFNKENILTKLEMGIDLP